MIRKRLLFGAALLVAMVAAPIAWYLISPLFITRTVNEDFPVAQAALQDSTGSSAASDALLDSTPAPSSSPMLEPTPEPTPTPSSSPMLEPTPEPTPAPSSSPMLDPTPEPTAAQPVVTLPTASAAPANEPKLLRSGKFHPVEHEGAGAASIYELPDGRRVLRLEDFKVLNGPDLYVWLSSAPDANDARTVLDSQYVSLGRLKGNQGNQNYELPADLDVSAFNSVTIWCRQFSVNFATAPLQ